jgi:hypothetical protein
VLGGGIGDLPDVWGNGSLVSDEDREWELKLQGIEAAHLAKSR